MYLTTEKKKSIFKEFGKSEFDSGSPEGQIALFTHRINHLTEHLRKNRKDKVTERALIMLVGKRRRLLDYLRSGEIDKYRSILKKLNIRK